MKFWKSMRRKQDRPVDEPGKADLHIHSDFSDGLSSVVSILDWVAMKTDISVVAITDHDVMEGSWLAQTLVRRYDYPFEVVPGVEVSTAEGHLLALFVNQSIPAGLSMSETIAAVHAQDGLAVLPHPYSLTGLLGTTWRYGDTPEWVYELPLDGVETFNGAMLISMCNRYSPRLASQLRKPALAGSDAHVHQAVGSCASLFPGRSASDLRNAIVAGNVMPAGRFWSPYAFLMTGVKWSLRMGEQLPLPRLPLDAWLSRREATAD